MIEVKLMVALLCVTFAVACTTNEGCTACVLDNACGYCSGSGKCMPGSEEGPSNNATCIGGWSFDTCLCSAPQTCKVCFEYDCVWCKGWDQRKGLCVPKETKANATCPLQWKPNEICPSEVDDIAILTFAILGTGLIVGISALGIRWFWKNKRGYFRRFKDEPADA
eukprot:Phypoly_transcript_15961.p1 GENE.Phypoly_transcript_15961~~Phypoly_transcript_15961.p1  ORF type:complete len:166 (+),score=17.30 Phypoly_transcript_15961:166-663(+)